jgi:hypothetical protein
MAQTIHYEVFRRLGARGGWTLQEAVGARDTAIKMAQNLMTEGRATGVKVVKESYNEETGDYLSLKIFEDGHNQAAPTPKVEDAPRALPCFRVEDLYSYHARATISRLLVEFLARNKLTATELLHSAEKLEKLEATGTLFQHAIQKVAVAQASSTSTPVQKIVKSLTALADQAIQRVYRDQRRGLFPDPLPEQFAILADQLAGQDNAAYIFNGAIARHLRDADSWDEKVHRLLTLMKFTPEKEAGRTLVLSSIDAILAEILGGSAALHELIGAKDNLAGALSSLVELFLGKPQEGGSGLTLLTSHFANDNLPEARTAIASRIINEFKSAKRLCPNSLVDELKALRKIANRVVLGVGKYMEHEELVAAFTQRSKRLVNQVTLAEYLEDATSPEERLERLLFVEDNIIGAENKRRLVDYVLPILNGQNFERHFQNPALPMMQRLQTLTALQAHVRRSGFQDNQKSEMADRLDRLAADVAARGKLFEAIAAKAGNAVNSVVKLLTLLNSGVFTEGLLADRARQEILRHLARPGFLTSYAAHLSRCEAPREYTRDKAMIELLGALGRAGIDAQTSMKTIAA